MSLEQDRETAFVLKHQNKIFVFALYLIGGDKDRAYEIASSGVAQALRALPSFESDTLIASYSHVLREGRAVKAAVYFDESHFRHLDPKASETLRWICAALECLPFDLRALVLLRDQANLSFRDIAAIFGSSESDVRNRTLQARLELRKNVEEALRRA